MSIANDNKRLPHNYLTHIILPALKQLENGLDYQVFEHKCDVSFDGWIIVLDDKTFIKFQYNGENEYQIEITRITIDVINLTLTPLTIFMGEIPSNDFYEPDYEFVKMLLKNYKCFE